jgi:hypothetical protein
MGPMDAIAIIVIVIFVVYLGCSKHSMHEELEAAHADPAGNVVLIELHHAEIVAQEPMHVLKHAVRGSRKSTQERRLRMRLLFMSLAFWNMFSCKCGWLIMAGWWSPCVSAGVVDMGSKTRDTHQGKPATITSILPGRGGSGSRQSS